MSQNGFWWFFGKSSAGSKILRKPLMLSVPFIVQYVHKNPTKNQINPASRFFVSLDRIFEKIKGSRFLL